MYSKFTSNDLTSGFSSVDLTSDYFMSADATASVASLTKQLQDATAELQKQEAIYNDNKVYWDACKFQSKAFKKAGFYHNGVYADSDCKNARDRMNAAAGKIAAIKKQIEELKIAIDKIGATDPAVIAAKGAAEAAIRSAESTGAATASRTKTIGWAIAGTIVLVGIFWGIAKLRKK